MKDIDVLFFIEHKDRELEIALEIKSVLENEFKLTVEISSIIYGVLDSLLQFRPKLIVTPSTAFAKGSASWSFNELYGDNVSYLNLNYEQFIASWRGNFKKPTHKTSMNKQKHFVWGDYFKKILSTGDRSIKESNIFITGRPHSSLMKKKYGNDNGQSRHEISKFLNINIKKKWYFVALTDGLFFVDEKKIQEIIDNGAIEDGLREEISYVSDAVKALFDWIYQISKDSSFDDIFILRPHPDVSEDQYRELFIELYGDVPKNVLIHKDYSGYKWLAACDKYITNYSTLCVDAKILGIDTYIVDRNSAFKKLSYWWVSGFKLITNISEFYSMTTNSDDLEIIRIDGEVDTINNDLDGIVESARVINSLVIKHNVKISTPMFKLFLLFFKSPKRLFGGYLRKIIASRGLYVKGITKKGVVNDYIDDLSINKFSSKK